MKKGFTLVEIMIVVAIIGLLAAIAIPSFMRARLTSQQNACINNMRQVEAAKDQFALENGLTNNAPITGADDTARFTALVGAGTGYIKTYPYCPGATSPASPNVAASVYSYTVNPVGSNCACDNNGSGAGSGTHILR